MAKVKDLLLRTYGDQGADTMDRLVAQVEFTAYHCVRMLHSSEGIEAVFPEWLEDTVVLRRGVYELTQVKTRDESQEPWTLAMVLPILCASYHRRGGFAGPCSFGFVSDGTADNRLRTQGYGSLYRLKHLLEIQQTGHASDAERDEMEHLCERFLPRIMEIMEQQFGEIITLSEARELVDRTSIDTQSHILRNPPALSELDAALQAHLPNGPTYSLQQLQRIYDRLVLAVIEKIRRGLSMDERRIGVATVLACTVPSRVPDDLPDLDILPGATTLDKKVLHGGFDASELPQIRRQKVRAEERVRVFRDLGLTESLDDFVLVLCDQQVRIRRAVSDAEPEILSVGPAVLERLRNNINDLSTRHLPAHVTLSELTVVGLLWIETAACAVWWHRLRQREAA